ncbi:endonuclease/exonuclease/phosphatase family protein [Nocardia sp. CC227C]|uniref:endonuclease/exonuclease/phosphatase family protein n=1 Tax=Nocardia sp. CC227C TaxID=3044562 RepID=UPI00278BF2F3|nr:endonuclease/exonuclease/phosphatase family protein [Nocardia sp. CC227C]
MVQQQGFAGYPGDAAADDTVVPARSRADRVRHRFSRVLLVLGWLSVVVGCAGVALHYASWAQREIVLAASFAPYLMLGAVAGAALLLLARGWRSALLAGAVVAAALFSQLTLFVPDGKADYAVEMPVMQSNLYFGKADADALVREVRDNGIELLTLEELTPEMLLRLEAAGLDAELPYRYVAPLGGGAGGGIFSRHPLRDGVTLEGFELANLRATMLHPRRGPVTVFQFHPVPPPLNFPAWVDEMRRIRELLTATSGPAVVGADFNATFDHYAYRQLLTGRFADAAELAGAGRLTSWPEQPSWGPVIGIDRVLVAEGQAEDVRTLVIPDSDHRAVLARLRL